MNWQGHGHSDEVHVGYWKNNHLKERVPTVIWRHNRNFYFLGKINSKIRILGHGDFYGFDHFFFTQCDPIGPKMDPRGSPPWFGAITVSSIFCKKSMTAG